MSNRPKLHGEAHEFMCSVTSSAPSMLGSLLFSISPKTPSTFRWWANPRTSCAARRRAMAAHELKEHAEAEEVMKELENIDEGDPKFDALARRLIEDIRHHVEDEDSDPLPKLRDACDEADLRELGKKFEQAKKGGAGPTAPVSA